MPQEPSPNSWSDTLGEAADNPATPRRAGTETIVLYWPCDLCDGNGQHPEAPPDLKDEPCPECKGTGKSSVIQEEHPVAPLEPRLQGQFEDWVRKKGKLSILEADRGSMPDEADRMRSVYIGDRGAGHYDYEGRHCRKARGDAPGMIYLLYLLMRRCDAAMTEEKAREVFLADPGQCVAAIAWASNPTTTRPETEARRPRKRSNGPHGKPPAMPSDPLPEKAAPTKVPTMDD